MNLEIENLKITAARFYRNPVCSDKEFEQDLALIKRVSGKIEKYSVTGLFPSNLVINNFVIACNCFGTEFVIKTLFLISNENDHELIKTFLEVILGVEVSNIRINEKTKLSFSDKDYNHCFAEKIREGIK